MLLRPRREVDICCVQEIRWRGTSTRLTMRKDSEYKMFCIRNNFGVGDVGILVPRK